MRLADFLNLARKSGHRILRYKFAEKIGVTPCMITDYVNDRAWPQRERFEAMVRESDGLVTPNDFLSKEARQLIATAQERAGIAE